MDKIFVIEKEYATKNIDGIHLRYLLAKLSKYHLDKMMVMTIEEAHNITGEKVIPVGDIEFVQSFLPEKMLPLEVPACLRRFVARDYDIMKGCEIPNDIMENQGNYFFKDADTLKKWNSSLEIGDVGRFIESDTNYVVSRKVNFLSEYRVFVFEDEVQACQYYIGDPLLFPERKYIETLVSEYSNHKHPEAYTLDVGIFENKSGYCTDIIEVHPFVACGLYGFSDRCIPEMLEAGYEWYKNQ